MTVLFDRERMIHSIVLRDGDPWLYAVIFFVKRMQ